MPAAFFSSDSFWNTPMPPDPLLHPDNEHFLNLTRWSAGAALGLHINLLKWTVPIFEADDTTSRVRVGRRLKEDVQGKWFHANSRPWLNPGHPEGHHVSFTGEGVPIPDAATPDEEDDAHLAIIDRKARRAWDMWAARRSSDGEWASCTGISYSLDGPGIFDPADFPDAHNGESIHLHGPGRATGVPIIAGLILHDEILAGRIEHKLAFAAIATGLLSHYFPPTTWTDGSTPRGLPGGVLLQLDPALDLAEFELSSGARVVARALQEYGAALVDYAGGFTLYGEGLWRDSRERSWMDTLTEEALFALGLEHFRFLAPETAGQRLVEKGMIPLPHPQLLKAYREQTGVPQLG